MPFGNLRFGRHPSTCDPITRDSKLMLKSSSKFETSNLVQFLLESMFLVFFSHGIHWPSVETKCVLYFVTKRVKSKRIFSSQNVFSLEKSHNLELQDLQNPFVLSWRNKMSPNTNIPINFMCHISGIKIFFWLWFKNIAKICNNLEEKQLLPGEYANFLQNWALIWEH